MKSKIPYHIEHNCNGALKSPDDTSDWIFEHLAHGPPGTYMSEFPDEFDLRKHTLTVRDQGERGTCAAFAAAAIKEIQENRDNGFIGYMSPEFIYYHRQNKPGNGMYGRNVFQILQKIGSVPESMYPYKTNVDEPLQAPSKKLYRYAAQFRIANFARVTTIDGLKRALLEMGPCYLLLPLFSTGPTFWCDDESKCRGGHAVTVIGYTTEGFIIRNSWGEEWNSDGHIIFPYADWGAQWECWVTIDEKLEKVVLAEKTKSIKEPKAIKIGKKKRKMGCMIM